ncbi:MAG: hypothetical protein K8S16_10100 [Bacteroidales bacterium]|nr:hypothetical protein [Bacteroidales bacterium]
MKTYNIIYYILLAILLVKPGSIITGQENKPLIPAKPLEIIDLETDRQLYISGETIWFRAFCMSKNSPPKASTLSTVLYVELYDSQLKTVSRQKIKITNGKANGAVIIPQEQPSGNYFIRAYTHYLRNYPAEFFPTKAITIINTEQPLTKYQEENLGEIKIILQNQSIVSGMKNIAAFTLSDDLAEQVDSMQLVDQEGRVYSEATCFENGSGIIRFTPKDSTTYQLIAYLSNGDSILQLVPKIQSTGFIASASCAGDSINYDLRFSPDFFKLSKNQHWTLNLFSGDLFKIFQTEINPGKHFSTSFQSSEISYGLNHFILLDQNDSTLDIQSIYNFNTGVITITPGKQQYAQKEEINLELKFTNENNPENVKISVAVVKKGTSTLLHNTLPRYIIKNPGLLNNYDIVMAVPDEKMINQVKACLILYQDQLLQSEQIWGNSGTQAIELKWMPETRGVNFSGIVRDNQTKQPVTDETVILANLTNRSDVYLHKSGKNGRFNFSLPVQFNQQDLFISTLNQESTKEILINTDFSGEYPVINPAPIAIGTNQKGLIEALYINYQLRSEFGYTNHEAHVSTESEKQCFGQPGISIRLEDYIDLPSMEVILNEIVPYVKYRERKGVYQITVLDPQTELIYNKPLVLVDNIPLLNTNDLIKIHPSVVEKIDVINRTYYLGDHVLQGIILITTKTGNFAGISMPGDASFINYQTLNPPVNFRQKTYETSDQYQSKKPDFRTLLYWNPILNLPQNTLISFYASDHCSEYTVVIKGIDSKGNSFLSVADFEVIGGY